jgi:DNA-binding transcriptional MerR regulator
MSRPAAALWPIGKIAASAGVTPDALRYYAREGLLSPTRRTDAGYRLYDADAVARLRFIRRAQRCGFTLAEIRGLLQFSGSRGAHCDDVRRQALQKKAQLTREIQARRAMLRTLKELIEGCGDPGRPAGDCPILTDLTGE